MTGRRRQLVFAVGIIALAGAGVGYTLWSGNEPLLGLDLQGGASVVLEPTRPASDEDLDLAVEIVRNRVDGLGVVEPEISRQGGNILVQLPGVEDQQRAIDLVGQTAELRFRPVQAAIGESAYQAAIADAVREDSEDREAAGDIVARFALTADAAAHSTAVLAQYDDERNVAVRYLLGSTNVTGDALESAESRFDGLTGWFVAPVFKAGPAGIDLFNALSEECFWRGGTCPTQQVAIEIDNEVVSAPVIQGGEPTFVPFERSNITITGSFTQSEAEDLALVLDYGALPVELEAQQSRIVSASLGTDALDAGVVAGIIGLIGVSLYLLFYYRLLGLIAIMSLAISGALLWTIISWMGEARGLALTLAGVTGLIVAIGVSVDSNVVYFEHLKEDVRSGRTVRSAVDRAFPIAFSTIVKADVASLIAAAVLYFLTVGQVRGFALYLGVATILDLVATYFFMGPAIRILAHASGPNANPAFFGIPRSMSAEPAR